MQAAGRSARLLAGLGLALGLLSGEARAQLVLDGSLGPAGPIAPVDGAYQITDDLGVFSAGGVNRYHSFSQFDLMSPGVAAVFSSLESPERVIVRVTEPNPFGGGSQINAPIRSTIPGADLFFLNPFGISFGPTAAIDVQGSFHASTADVLRFPEGRAAKLEIDSTALPDLLSVAEPTAFGFRYEAPAPIGLFGTDALTVPEGETLSFVGGELDLADQRRIGANVRAPGATVQLAAVGGPAEVPLDLASLDPADLPAAPADCPGPGCVRLYLGMMLDVSGDETGGAAGSIVIRGGRFELDNATLLAVHRDDATDALGPVDVAVNGAIVIGNGSRVLSASEGAGRGGDLLLSAPRIEIEGGRILSEAHGAGDGGDLVIDAESLLVSNARNHSDGAFLGTNTLAEMDGGTGGDLEIRAAQVEMLAGGQGFARTEGSGDAGALSAIEADRILVEGIDSGDRPSGFTARALESATGAGGDLTIDTGTLEVANGGQISAATFGAGAAGNLDIEASERVLIRGGDEGASLLSAASRLIGGGSRPLGPSGNLTVEAPRVELVDGGQISVSTAGTLAAGNVTIVADEVSIRGRDPAVGNASGIFAQSISTAADGGAAGNVSIEARDGVTLADGGRVSSLSRGGGDAGSITIDGGERVELTTDASISTEALTASGGKVDVSATEAVVLWDAGIKTRVLEGEGGGGDVTLDSDFVLLNRGEIIAKADRGPGGNIRIRADAFLASPDSVVDASSQLGIDGEVEIDASDAELTGRLAVLPQQFLDASQRLGDPCDARTEQVGSFVVRRGGALPASPDAPLAPEGAREAERPGCPLAEETP